MAKAKIAASRTPRILLYDLETSHNLVAVFSLKNQDWIAPENIIQERFVICASWKWLGDKTVHSVSVLDNRKLYKSNPHDDSHVLATLHGVLMTADVIVAHNGNDFDAKFAAGRMLIHGFSPLPPIPQIDTLKVARERFLLNANNLDYLGRLLKVGRKKPTTTGLWLRILKGDAAAVAEMVRYNKQDVLLLERVFLKLQPYIANHPSRHLFGAGGTCPRCGSHHVQARGIHKALTQTYQRWQCIACGGWFRSKKSLGTVPTRVL